MKTLDNLFDIMRIINDSDKPLTARDIAEQHDTLGVRMVQRYAIRLATEGLVSFRVKARGEHIVGGTGYEYMPRFKPCINN